MGPEADLQLEAQATVNTYISMQLPICLPVEVSQEARVYPALGLKKLERGAYLNTAII